MTRTPVKSVKSEGIMGRHWLSSLSVWRPRVRLENATAWLRYCVWWSFFTRDYYAQTFTTLRLGLIKLKYSEYLKTNRWKKKRKKARRLYQSCMQCGSKENLEVYHRNLSSLGRENMYTDLSLFCKNCVKLFPEREYPPDVTIKSPSTQAELRNRVKEMQMIKSKRAKTITGKNWLSDSMSKDCKKTADSSELPPEPSTWILYKEQKVSAYSLRTGFYLCRRKHAVI